MRGDAPDSLHQNRRRHDDGGQGAGAAPLHRPGTAHEGTDLEKERENRLVQRHGHRQRLPGACAGKLKPMQKAGISSRLFVYGKQRRAELFEKRLGL